MTRESVSRPTPSGPTSNSRWLRDQRSANALRRVMHGSLQTSSLASRRSRASNRSTAMDQSSSAVAPCLGNDAVPHRTVSSSRAAASARCCRSESAAAASPTRRTCSMFRAHAPGTSRALTEGENVASADLRNPGENAPDRPRRIEKLVSAAAISSSTRRCQVQWSRSGADWETGSRGAGRTRY